MNPGTLLRGGKGLETPEALALVSALLLILAQPPFRLILLPFSALAPLVVAVASLEAAPGRSRRAAWIGMLFGMAFWGILLVWVPLVVGPRHFWAFPGYGVQVGILAGLTSLMAWSASRLHTKARVPFPLAFALAWVAMEWVKGHFPLGLAFPWLGLGISLTSWPALLGLAEWTGEPGVAFWLAAVNGLLGCGVVTWLRRGADPVGSRRTSLLGLSLLSVVTVAGPVLLGSWRIRNLPLEAGPEVAVVGTDVSAELRLRGVEGSREALAQVEAAMAGGEWEGLDLVILPEATVALPLDGPGGGFFLEALGGMSHRMGVPILVGALGQASTSGVSGTDPDSVPGKILLTNSAFLVDSEGRILSRYDKVRLVPGMEWGRYRAGLEGATMRSGEVTLAPLICYESIFGGRARTQRERGASLLVNLSSDVWFGEGRGLGRFFLPQHPAHLVMRAVESRLGVARAANGGISVLLDPGGKPLVSSLPPGVGMIRAEIPVMAGGSLFSRTGDLLGPMALLAVGLLLLGTLVRKKTH